MSGPVTIITTIEIKITDSEVAEEASIMNMCTEPNKDKMKRTDTSKGAAVLKVTDLEAGTGEEKNISTTSVEMNKSDQ